MSNNPEVKTDSTSTKVPVPDGLINPASQGYVNALVAAAVKEAIAGMLPLVKEMALTPEKLAEAERLRRAPDPERVAQMRRQDRIAKLDLEESAKLTALARASCPHRHPDGKIAVGIVNNTFDKRPRFICMTCQEWFYPSEWQIAAPTEDEPRGKPYVREAHKQYREILISYRTEHPEAFV